MSGFKTIIFNLLVAIFTAVRYFYPELILPSEEDVNSFLNAVDAVVLSSTVIINLILRFFTKTKVFNK